MDGPGSGCSCESLSMMTVVLACKAARESPILLNAIAAGGAKDTCKRGYHTKRKSKIFVTYLHTSLERNLLHVQSICGRRALLQQHGPSLPSSSWLDCLLLQEAVIEIQ